MPAHHHGEGKLGELRYELTDNVDAKIEDGKFSVAPKGGGAVGAHDVGHHARAGREHDHRRIHGLHQDDGNPGHGFPRRGDRPNLVINLGFSHDVVYPVPAGITITTPRPTAIAITGVDKRQVGQVALRYALTVRRSLTRARACGTTTSKSAARKARRNERTRDLRERRRERLRYQLKQKSGGRVRLSVFRSGKNIYAQVIDDKQGRTLAAASSLDKTLRTDLRTGADKAAASAVGKLVAERALAAGVTQVVFDRGEYLYHGRVKRWPRPAREGGLAF